MSKTADAFHRKSETETNPYRKYLNVVHLPVVSWYVSRYENGLTRRWTVSTQARDFIHLPFSRSSQTSRHCAHARLHSSLWKAKSVMCRLRTFAKWVRGTEKSVRNLFPSGEYCPRFLSRARRVAVVLFSFSSFLLRVFFGDVNGVYMSFGIEAGESKRAPRLCVTVTRCLVGSFMRLARQNRHAFANRLRKKKNIYIFKKKKKKEEEEEEEKGFQQNSPRKNLFPHGRSCSVSERQKTSCCCLSYLRIINHTNTNKQTKTLQNRIKRDVRSAAAFFWRVSNQTLHVWRTLQI